MSKKRWSLIPVADVKTPIYVSLVTTAILGVSTIILYFQIQPVMPLFYSLALPHQFLVNKEWLFLFPVFSLGITLLHLLVLHLIKSFELVLVKLFAWSTVMLQVMLTLAMIRIIANII